MLCMGRAVGSCVCVSVISINELYLNEVSALSCDPFPQTLTSPLLG